MLVNYSRPRLALVPRFKDSATKGINYISTEQGLNASAVLSVLKDGKGRLWIGTWEGGVSCYDGTYLTHFTAKEGLSDNRVYSMMEDSQGRIWFGTFGGGLICYDGNNFTIYNSSQGLLNDWVFAMTEDQQGNLWFGTVYGACKLILEKPIGQPGNRFIHYTTEQGLSGNHIQAMLLDKQGNLWFGTNQGGATCFDGQSFTQYTTNEGLPSNDIRSVFQDHQSRIWLGTNGGGVCVLEGKSLFNFTITDGLNHNTIMSIAEDESDRLYFGSLGGLNIFDGQTFTSFQTEEGLTLNTILCLALDHETSSAWLGTDGGGLNHLEHQGHWYLEEQSLGNRQVKVILQDKQGAFWFGTYGGGAIKYDGRNFTCLLNENGLIDDKVDDLIEDRNGKIWIATNSGVSQFDGEYFTNYTTEEGLCFNIINDLYEDKNGYIWVGTNGGGLSRFDGVSFSNYQLVPDLKFNIINQILEDKEGYIWLATRMGLARFDGHSYTYFTTNEGLVDNNVFALFIDRKGRMWIGTEGGLSLIRTELTGSPEDIINFTTEEGLSHNNIRSIREDEEHNIWVITEKGITILSPGGGEGPSAFKTIIFGEGSELKTNQLEKGIYLDQNNQLWLGTKRGAMRLELEQFRFPKGKPKNMQLLHLEVEQQFVSFRELQDASYRNTFSFGKTLNQAFDSVSAFYNYPIGLKLPHHINHLTFHFSAIDWQAPQRLQYTYKMDGLEEKWSPLQANNQADYRNLPPGNYTFKIKAMSAAQEWSNVFEYPFRIYPPWWQTWWAYCLYLLFVLLTLYSLYQYQKKRWQLRASLQKEKEESMRLKELEAFKSRFYANITHEFRTPLTVIQGLADQIQENPRWKVAEHTGLIKRNSQKLLQLINQMLDLSKLEAGRMEPHYIQGDIIKYLSYLVESFHSPAINRNISLSFYAHTDSLLMDYDPEKCQQVVSNLLSNAIKFTPEYGKIKVVAKVLADGGQRKLEVSVQDTGTGIPPDQLPYIFDRFYQAPPNPLKSGELTTKPPLSKPLPGTSPLWGDRGGLHSPTSGGLGGATGSGLGLALAKELLELMGGNIEVESEVGKGTRFTFRLPVHNEAKIEEKTPLPTPVAAASKITTSLGPVRQAMGATREAPSVLVVEDSLDVIYYLRECLQGRYQVLEASNGREGIAKAQETIPDLVVSDVMMPEVDGFELCEVLKKDERTSHIPVILLTAKATQEDKLEGLNHGADAYLVKPFQKEELLIRLEKLLELRRKLQQKYQSASGDGPGPEDDFLRKVREIVEAHLEEPDFSVEQMSRVVGMSRVQVHRKLKALTGLSASQFIRITRLNRAYELLKDPALNISEVAYQVGFKDPSHFSRVFSQQYGVAPSELRGGKYSGNLGKGTKE
ncbi:MAG: response regulator [Lewinellaceae bacterium]|nr:response regulator [Lewinellaceae bacterium]